MALQERVRYLSCFADVKSRQQWTRISLNLPPNFQQAVFEGVRGGASVEDDEGDIALDNIKISDDLTNCDRRELI